MSEFLENLKKAADEGIFNSEAARKILEVNELADIKLGKGTPEDLEKLKENLEKRLENSEETKETKSMTKEEVIEINSEYEKKMAAIKKQDAVNAQLAILIEIEDMVKASVNDMFSFTEELKFKFEKELEAKDPIFNELVQKIEEIDLKYKTIIN